MSNQEKMTDQPCGDCVSLRGAGRHTRPHKNLQLVEFNAVKSMFGSVDETYYKCAICAKEWLHEAGNCGQGWVE